MRRAETRGQGKAEACERAATDGEERLRHARVATEAAGVFVCPAPCPTFTRHPGPRAAQRHRAIQDPA